MTQKNKTVTRREAWRSTVRAWGITREICPQLFASKLLSAVCKAAAPYATLWFSAQLIDELSGARDPQKLTFWVLWTLGVTAAFALASGVLTRWDEANEKLYDMAEDRLYSQKMQSLDYIDLDGQAAQNLYSQICQSRNWACFGLPMAVRALEAFVGAVTQIVGGIALTVTLFLQKTAPGSNLAWLDHPLCVIAVLAAMLALVLLSGQCEAVTAKGWAAHSGDATFSNRARNFYSYYMTHQSQRDLDLRMYRQATRVSIPFLQRFNGAFAPGSPYAKMCATWGGLLDGLSQLLIAAMSGVAYLYVGLKALAGAFGVGAVTQYVGALTQLFTGLANLSEAMSVMLMNGSFLEQCFALLDYPNKMYQGSLTTEKRSDRNYTVEFRDVSFRYPGSEQYALRHVNMKFKVGSRLAVVGRNGSGKTTFIKLLCRLYDPTEGEILLNGINIKKYRYDEYMDIFSVVFQDFKLFALPLGQNVAARRDYDDARVTDCLEKAGFAERLARMPHGLETYLYKDLDKEGVDVSGGEAQKIAIARALYKDAPFIILDEPTAALDPIAEADIYSKFNDIAGDKTAIYISHRLSSCKFCDEIAVFDGGCVVQQGTHDTLLADTTGIYCALWNAQAQYYVKE